MRPHDEEALALLADALAMRTEGQRARRQIIEALRRMIGAEGGMLLLGSSYLAPKAGASADANTGVDKSKSRVIVATMRHFVSRNPVLPYLTKLDEPAYIHRELLGKRGWEESEYYRGFLRPIGTRSAAGLTLRGPDGAILGGMFFGHPDARGFTPRSLSPLRALARYVGCGLHEILEWERWQARWGSGLTALVGEMSDAVMIVQCAPGGRAELLAVSPAAERLLALRDRGESRNLELRELLGASLEASGPAGQRLLWTARSGARFEVKASALPSSGGFTLMIRLVTREPRPTHEERPLLELAREAGLTAREASILDALSRGRSHKEVAAELGIAYFTVTTHVRNLFSKLGVSNRVDAINAVRRVREAGLRRGDDSSHQW